MLTRREMIRRGFFAPALLAAAKGVAAQDVNDIVLNPSPAVVPFTRRLKIPRPHLPLNRPGATPLEMAKAQSIFEQSVAEGRFKHDAYPPSSACDYYEVVMKSEPAGDRPRHVHSHLRLQRHLSRPDLHLPARPYRLRPLREPDRQHHVGALPRRPHARPTRTACR